MELTGKDGGPLIQVNQVNALLQESVSVFERVNLLTDPVERERQFAQEMDKILARMKSSLGLPGHVSPSRMGMDKILARMESRNIYKAHKDLIRELNRHRFSHSGEFEMGMRLILGHGTADSAGMPKEAKKLLLQAVNRMATRIDEIVTMDERLREMLFMDFEGLKKLIKEMDKVTNEMDIYGMLFRIIGRLLGYDWIDGKVYRTPVYFRTKSQELDDYKEGYAPNWRDFAKEENNLVLERRKICVGLKDQGMPLSQIARVLNISEHAARQLITDKALPR